MIFKEQNFRPLKEKDIPFLEKWRREYWDADLEIPHGYVGEGVETAVNEVNGRLLQSMTATQAMVIDPLIRDYSVTNGREIIAGIIQLERSLAYIGQRWGAVDAYIAVPNQLKDYHKIVEKAGYVRTCEHCTIFRRPLRPDHVPLLGSERAAAKISVVI